MMGREVLVIQNRDIYGLNISPLECVKWGWMNHLD